MSQGDLLMAVTMTEEYAKSLCSPALLRDLSMDQIAEIRRILSASGATTELNILFQYTDELLKQEKLDPRDFEPLRQVYDGNDPQIARIDQLAIQQLDISIDSGYLSHYKHGNKDAYINNASLTTLAQDIALLQYSKSYSIGSVSVLPELNDLEKSTTARIKDPNISLSTYADLNAVDYLINKAGLTLTDDELNSLQVQVAQLDRETGLPDFEKEGMVDLVNKNALALNRSFNNINTREILEPADSFLNKLWGRVHVFDDATNTLENKTKDDYFESLVQAAQVEVYRENITNDKFAVLSADKQRDYVSDAVKKQVMADIIVARAASGFDDKIRETMGIPAPNANQKVAGSPAQAEYNRQVLAQIKTTLGDETNAQNLINDLTAFLDDSTVADDDKAVKINPFMLLANHADKDVDLEAFTRRLNQKLVEHDTKNETKKYRHTAVRLANRLHGQVEEKGRRTFGEKAYAMAVNMRRFLNNNPGKAWEMVGTLGIAGGSVAMTLGLVSNPAAYAIGTAMVTHYFCKSYLYPTLDQMKRLSATNEEYAQANFIKKWKMARAAVKKADKYHNFGRNAAAMSIITGVAGGCFAGPLGARAGVALMTAGANMWRTWRDANQAKIMYKRTGDSKYLDQLKGAHSDKIANSKGLKKLGWKAWNFMTSKKGQQVISTGGFLGAAFGMSMRMANANTVTELASHGQAINQSGLTAAGTQGLAPQMVAASEVSRAPDSLKFDQIIQNIRTDSTEMVENTINNQEVTLQNDTVAKRYIFDFREALYQDVNTQAKTLPNFRFLQDKLAYLNGYDSRHLSTPAGDPLREIIEKGMQDQLKLLADDSTFQQLKATLPQQDQETVDTLIKSGNYRGLSQFIESGQFQSEQDHIRNTMGETIKKLIEQHKNGTSEIMKNYQEDSLYLNTKLEEFAHDENTAKIMKGLDENGGKKLIDVLLTKDEEKINAFLAKQKTPLRVDNDGNVLNSVQHSSTNEILYGEGHRSGDAEFMKTYTTRTDAAYTKMLDRQAVHSHYNDHFVVNGEQKMVTSAEYLKDAQDRVAENFIKGKPEGMTVKDYVVHRHMLREYIHVDTERDLNGELSRVGVTREQWQAFLKGEYAPEVSDKIFMSKLGGHAGRVLIDKEVICGEQLNAEQVKIVHRALSLNNHDPKSAFSAGRALYVEAYGVPSYANNNYGLQPHWHYETDCDGKGKWVQHIVGSEKKTIDPVKNVIDAPQNETIEPNENPEPVIPEAIPPLEFDRVLTDPKTTSKVAYILKRVMTPYGSLPREFDPNSPNPSYITIGEDKDMVKIEAGQEIDLRNFTENNQDPVQRNNLRLGRGKEGIRMTSWSNIENKSMKLWFYDSTTGKYVSENCKVKDLLLTETKVAQPISATTYTQDEVNEAVAKWQEFCSEGHTLKPNEVSPTTDGGYVMITEKGTVMATPDPEANGKFKVTIKDLDNKEATNLTQDEQKEIFENFEKQIQDSQNNAATQSQEVEKPLNQQKEPLQNNSGESTVPPTEGKEVGQNTIKSKTNPNINPAMRMKASGRTLA